MDNKFKVIAFDLDGTLTEHRTKLDINNKKILDKLSEKYKLIMFGAGKANRIFEQMNEYPIDIIGNYGMQYFKYNFETKKLDVIFNKEIPIDKNEIEKRVIYLRNKYNYTDFKGDSVEYHESGCITFPLLGKSADIKEKLIFDPDKKKRRYMYNEVKNLFPEYTTFIGGSSSFDFAPQPYNKLYAIENYAKDNNYKKEEILYVGDDYKEGGNDEDVYKSDFNFQIIDNYNNFPNIMLKYL